MPRLTIAIFALSLLTTGCGGAEPEVEVEKAGPPAADDGAFCEIEVEGVPELSGRALGGLVFLPPAHKVVFRNTARGTPLHVKSKDAWENAGGTQKRLGPDALEVFTPQLPGRGEAPGYELEVQFRDMDVNIGKGILMLYVVILHEAEVTQDAKTGKWQVKLGDEFSHTYPNPEKAKSWRVRMHAEEYRPPRFWMKITPDNEDQMLAPHLLVGQMVGFVTNKDKSAPKKRHAQWSPPSRRLVYKLAMIGRELESQGVKFERLAVNSCFRTPAYNRKIGGSGHSRHIYGDAADVMIDEDDDEVCDDISGDGVVDEKDGLVVGQAIRKLENAGRVRPGGTGVYGFDGPESCKSYVHFDARGFTTRWGTVHRRGRKRGLDWWPAEEYREDEEPPPEFRDAPGESPKK